ncbi:MAG: hypothetical protein RIA63_09350, partial [Cyclobacteriaceae bacterium]
MENETSERVKAELDEFINQNSSVNEKLDGHSLYQRSLITPEDTDHVPLTALAVIENEAVKVIAS